ncbi:MAG TPA: lipopolysaccharide biosynthesis protein [Bacillota bacterium]|nr:lipopolysaccharide biosynthesis protein [Bacillota bacterium]
MTVQASRTEKALTGSLWLLSGMGGREALLFFLSIVLARILVPEDFAAIALVMAIIAIVDAFAQLGLSVALVQRPSITPRLLDSAFILTSVTFPAGSALLLLFSKPLADYYILPLLSPLIKLTAFSILFLGFTSFYRSLLLRDMKYHAISATEILATLIYGMIAVILGVKGYGAYSILWGHIGGASVTLIAFVALKPFFPKSLGSIRLMKELMSFGAWVSLGRVLGTASGQFDRFLIGKILAEQTLGGYYLAYRMTTALPNLVTGAVDQVLLPIYSNSKNDPQVIERGYWKGLRYSAITVVPISLLLAVFAHPAVWLLLGEKWIFIVPVVQILSIFGALHGLGGGLLASAIYASGIPRLNPVINGFRIVVLPACVWLGSQWGVEGVAWGVAAFGFTGRLFNQWLLKHYLGYSFLTFFRVIALPLLANSGILAIGLVVHCVIPPYSLQSVPWVLSLVSTVAVYVCLCRYLLPEEYYFIIEQVHNRVGKKGQNALRCLFRRV